MDFLHLKELHSARTETNLQFNSSTQQPCRGQLVSKHKRLHWKTEAQGRCCLFGTALYIQGFEQNALLKDKCHWFMSGWQFKAVQLLGMWECFLACLSVCFCLSSYLIIHRTAWTGFHLNVRFWSEKQEVKTKLHELGLSID